MLRYNTFRSARYLRTRFVEGRYLLASEATDLQLENIDLLREYIKKDLGNVAIDDGWLVTCLGTTQLKVNPGEAWFEGLPFVFRCGEDQLVSTTGGYVESGTLPVGVSISQNSSGKLINFTAGSTPGDIYAVVVTAKEQLVTVNDDPFLKNANLTEATSVKVRLVYQINVIPNSFLNESPVPYTNDVGDKNLVNKIVTTAAVTTPYTIVSGSEGIDGRNLEIKVANPIGSNSLPSSSADQTAFSHGKLIDTSGQKFHLVSVTNNPEDSNEAILRVDKEVGQGDPDLSGAFTLVKRDVYVTPIDSDYPQGKLFYKIAELVWDGTKFEHPLNSVTDLRVSVPKTNELVEKLKQVTDVVVSGGGSITWNSTTGLMAATSDLLVTNSAYSGGCSIAIGGLSVPVVEGGSLVYDLDFTGALNVVSVAPVSLTITSGGTDITVSSPSSLATAKPGMVVKDSAGNLAVIISADSVTGVAEVSSALVTGAAQLFTQSYAEGAAPKSLTKFTLATRKNNKLHFYGGALELESGETNSIGDGVSQQLLDFIGATSESDDSPAYSSNNHVDNGDSLVAAIGKLDSAVGASDSDISDLTDRVDTLETDVSALTGRVDTLETDVSDLTSREDQDRSAKLIGGGVWAWATGGVTSEVQVISFADTPDTGTWQLQFSGNNTSVLQWNANAATIQSALEAVSGIGVGNVTVSGNYIDGFTVTFIGALVGVDVPLLLIVNNTLFTYDDSTGYSAYLNSTYVGANGIYLDGGTYKQVAQQFTISQTSKIYSFSMKLGATSGVGGTIVGKIVADNAGLPTGAILDSVSRSTLDIYTEQGSSTIHASSFSFTVRPILLPGTYWYVLDATAATLTGGEVVAVTATATNDGTGKKYNSGTSSWDSHFSWTNQVLASTQINPTALVPTVATTVESYSTNLSLSDNAYIDIPGVTRATNRIAAQTVSLPNTTSTAYVLINRTTQVSPSPLSVTVSDVATITPSDNLVVVARRDGSDVLVGNSFRLIGGQSKTLDAGLSVQTKTLLGSGVTEATSSPSYSTRGAPQRTLLNSQGILDALASVDSELDKFFGQLQLKAHSSLNKLTITGADKSMLDSALISQELNEFLMSFTGAVINFSTGAILKDDDVTALGVNFTPFSIPVGQYFWYGIAAIPAAVTADNRQEIQIQVTPASAANAAQASAPFPVIAGDKKLGAIQVRNNAGSIEVVSIRRLGVGAGGGGTGTGDANAIVETVKNRLLDSPFQLATPIVARTDKATKLDGATAATYSPASRSFEFSSAQALITAQMLDDEFLTNTDALAEVELLAFWSLSYLDTAATYQVSRNGSAYQTVTMSRVGSTELYRGTCTFTDEVTNQTLATHVTSGSTLLAELTGAAFSQQLAQSFTVSNKILLKSLTLEINKTGSPSGNIYVSLVKDSAGNPSSSVADLLSESAAIPVSSIPSGTNNLVVNMPDVYLTSGTYHIVLRSDAAYKASHVATTTMVSWRSNSVGIAPYIKLYNSSTQTWSSISYRAGYIVTGITLDLRVKITSSADGKRLDGLAALYDKLPGTAVAGVKKREVVSFKAVANNTSTFTLTKFLPDPELLSCYYVQGGQVFKYPAFQLSGMQVIFPTDTFNNGGVEADVTLVFSQSEGSSYDNSDTNAALLAANALGSADATIDRSSAGRGIMLRSPNGTLYEITIRNGGTGFDIYEVT